MKDKQDFYIGWQEKMPASQWKRVRWFIIGALVLIPVLTILVSWLQQPFNDHNFELGQLREITGTYLAEPVPILVADEGQLPADLSRHILLVGFGKFGAESIMEGLETSEGPLSGKTITLEGTLIYGSGKTVMEMTRLDKSLKKVAGPGAASDQMQGTTAAVNLAGEILDPKCYFGVMKPGEGKIHKSCAIRCISGGIPPVLRAPTGDGTYNFYLVLGKDGEKINQSLLDYVAEPIEVNGQVEQKDGWDILYLDLVTSGAIVRK